MVAHTGPKVSARAREVPLADKTALVGPSRLGPFGALTQRQQCRQAYFTAEKHNFSLGLQPLFGSDFPR